MSNKIKIGYENGSEAHITVSHERRKPFGRRAIEAVGLAASGVILAAVGNEVVAAQNATPQGSESYTIQPGDTLTDIAVEEVHDGAEDVKDTVDAILDMNEDLEAGNLPVGNEIKIPTDMD